METEPKQQLPSSFTRLNVAQFLGAMNDNILKLLITFFLIRLNGAENAGVVAATVGAVFVAPYLLFSAAAGCVADRFQKSQVIVAIKVMEVAVAVFACAAFVLEWQTALYAVAFLMGTHSAFFAPAKYGIIPELAPPGELSRANGYLEAATYVAIILGTTGASVLASVSGAHPFVAAASSVAIACAGLAAAAFMSKSAAADASRHIALLPTEIFRTLNSIRGDRDLMLAIIGQAYFMFVGAFAQLNLIGYGMQEMALSETQSGYLFLAAAVGIGSGSVLAARLSGRDVEFGVVPLGAIGLAVAPILLHAFPSSVGGVVCILFLFGLSAGLFSLPLQTFIQFKADPATRGEVLAASTFVNWIGVLAASGMTYILNGPLHLTAGQSFTILGLLTAVLSAVTVKILPDFLLRFIALVTMRIFYRIKVTGRDNVPVTGPALLIPNHVTWVDALLLTATNQRRIRFVMERRIYNTPFLRSLFRLMGVIPVSATDGRREMLEFIRRTRAALDDGYMVCIFAEGAITRNGMLREFRGGFERIVRDSGYPVIPVYIGGAWGSILSYAHGRLLSRPPALAPYHVSILFGKPMPATSTAAEVRQAVMELSCDYFASLKPSRKPLPAYFLETARKNWRRRAISDTSGKALTYGETAVGAVALSRKLKALAGEAEHVGVLLPPSAGAVLTNLALAFAGKIPVNLNYTTGETVLRSAISQCGITTIITSRAFVQKLPVLEKLEAMTMIEDIIPNISPADKLTAFLTARLFPPRYVVKAGGFTADAVATIIFSSGSTGEPKGVMLTHHNIMSNIEALRMVFRVDLNDNICSALPFFHSLGFTATLWFPLVSGFSASYHVNPMEGEKIAEVVRNNRSTLLLATPTFLLGYIRRAKKEDFASLRLVVTGAEKLKPKVADAFETRFGVRPLEGYGATELSPVITLSLPDVEIDGVRQHGAKEGSVGHPVPGVAIKVVDPDTGERISTGEQGLIMVKGPNVMLGYLSQPGKTADVIKDDWYVTGDMGVLDNDGFIRITDRMSRFSKIGGEMVPHGLIEDELHNRLGSAGVVAVTAVPDEKKGEKLAVLFTESVTDAETLQKFMNESSLPNIWKPGKDSYIAVDKLPILGTGKLDLKGLRVIATEALASAA